MKLCFRTTDEEETAFLTLTAEAPTILQCLAKLEEQICQTCAPMAFTDDLAFDVGECVELLNNGQPYRRTCFSTPEENFEIAVVED